MSGTTTFYLNCKLPRLSNHKLSAVYSTSKAKHPLCHFFLEGGGGRGADVLIAVHGLPRGVI